MEAKPSANAILGNEASARGAFEAGARLSTGYPGTPATAAIEYLLANHKSDLRVEWSVNEKVALDVALGHSWAGQRSYVALKMSGLNVALDSLLSAVASGTRGGLVVMVGDDPGVSYGMVEQDSRLFAKASAMPCVEPDGPAEAKELTFAAFGASESCGAPIMVRMTTGTANMRGPVNFEQTTRLRQKSSLPDDLEKFTKVWANSCREQHRAAMGRLAEVGALLDRFNTLQMGSERFGVIAAASSWSYLEEFLRGNLKGKLTTLKVVTANPLPEEKIAKVLESCDKVLIIEELE
ncbi:hypothetical protein FDZ71_06310, partial [bacterium]